MIDSKIIIMTSHPARTGDGEAFRVADLRSPHTTLGALVRRIQRHLAPSAERCPSRHYDDFLQRTVRCRQRAGHGDDHRFRTLDQTVVWH